MVADSQLGFHRDVVEVGGEFNEEMNDPLAGDMWYEIVGSFC